jgi:hypothetical protein
MAQSCGISRSVAVRLLYCLFCSRSPPPLLSAVIVCNVATNDATNHRHQHRSGAGQNAVASCVFVFRSVYVGEWCLHVFDAVRQNAEIALLNGQIQLIDTNTKVIQGEQQQQIQFYLANTTRDATIITQNAAANGMLS